MCSVPWGNGKAPEGGFRGVFPYLGSVGIKLAMSVVVRVLLFFCLFPPEGAVCLPTELGLRPGKSLGVGCIR